MVDGPFGSPSSNIYRAEHAVLVGTGIGVTPFASILQSIMMRCCNTALQLGFTKLSLTDPGSPDLCQYNQYISSDSIQKPIIFRFYLINYMKSFSEIVL